MQVAVRYAFALGIMLVSVGAAAQPSLVDVHRAEGERASADRKWAKARVQYQLALLAAEEGGATWEQRAPIVGALGLAELSLGRHRDAAEHLASALERGAGQEASVRASWEAGLNRAVARIGRIYVGVNPPDATVQLDGHTVGSSRRSYVLYVEPGEHTVSVRREDFYRAMQTAEVGEGQSRSIGFRLERVPLSPVSMPPEPGRSATAGLLQGTGIGLAALGLLLGTAFAIAGESDDAAAERTRTRMLADGLPTNACAGDDHVARCAELHGTLERRGTMDTAAQVSFVAGGAIGVATAVWYFWPAPKRGLQVRPTIAGITARGTW